MLYTHNKNGNIHNSVALFIIKKRIIIFNKKLVLSLVLISDHGTPPALSYLQFLREKKYFEHLQGLNPDRTYPYGLSISTMQGSSKLPLALLNQKSTGNKKAEISGHIKRHKFDV